MSDDRFSKDPGRGPIKEVPGEGDYTAAGRKVPGSHQADPKYSVANADRRPEPYKDLRTRPNVTGTYFDYSGRYRLFINHVGGHIEGLLTLWSNEWEYQKLGDDGKGPATPARLGRHATDRQSGP